MRAGGPITVPNARAQTALAPTALAWSAAARQSSGILTKAEKRRHQAHHEEMENPPYAGPGCLADRAAPGCSLLADSRLLAPAPELRHTNRPIPSGPGPGRGVKHYEITADNSKGRRWHSPRDLDLSTPGASRPTGSKPRLALTNFLRSRSDLGAPHDDN
jgi:hypothetical protein